MFLDEELLQLTVDTVIKSKEDIQELNKGLFAVCFNHYKSRLTPSISQGEMKVLLDRTFISFDLFVVNAKKHPDAIIRKLGDLFEEYTFKKQFLQDRQARIAYESL